MLGISWHTSASPFPLLLGFNLYFSLQSKMLLFLVFPIKLVQLRESQKYFFQQWIRASFFPFFFLFQNLNYYTSPADLMQSQQVSRGDSAPQLCWDPPGMLHPALGSPVQERHEPVGVSPEEARKMIRRMENLFHKERWGNWVCLAWEREDFLLFAALQYLKGL